MSFLYKQGDNYFELSYEEIIKSLDETVKSLTCNQREQIIEILLEIDNKSFISPFKAIKSIQHESFLILYFYSL
jgi:hypothetical protein